MFCFRSFTISVEYFIIPDGFDVIPIGHSGERSFLFSGSAVYGEQLASSVNQHLCIFYGFSQIFEAANFACNWNR